MRGKCEQALKYVYHEKALCNKMAAAYEIAVSSFGIAHSRLDRILGVYGDLVVKRSKLRCLCRLVFLSSLR